VVIIVIAIIKVKQLVPPQYRGGGPVSDGLNDHWPGAHRDVLAYA